MRYNLWGFFRLEKGGAVLESETSASIIGRVVSRGSWLACRISDVCVLKRDEFFVKLWSHLSQIISMDKVLYWLTCVRVYV